jgi:hypothetical protein
MAATALFLFCDLGDQPIGPSINEIDQQQQTPAAMGQLIPRGEEKEVLYRLVAARS